MTIADIKIINVVSCKKLPILKIINCLSVTFSFAGNRSGCTVTNIKWVSSWIKSMLQEKDKIKSSTWRFFSNLGLKGFILILTWSLDLKISFSVLSNLLLLFSITSDLSLFSCMLKLAGIWYFNQCVSVSRERSPMKN